MDRARQLEERIEAFNQGESSLAAVSSSLTTQPRMACAHCGVTRSCCVRFRHAWITKNKLFFNCLPLLVLPSMILVIYLYPGLGIVDRLACNFSLNRIFVILPLTTFTVKSISYRDNKLWELVIFPFFFAGATILAAFLLPELSSSRIGSDAPTTMKLKLLALQLVLQFACLTVIYFLTQPKPREVSVAVYILQQLVVALVSSAAGFIVELPSILTVALGSLALSQLMRVIVFGFASVIMQLFATKVLEYYSIVLISLPGGPFTNQPTAVVTQFLVMVNVSMSIFLSLPTIYEIFNSYQDTSLFMLQFIPHMVIQKVAWLMNVPTVRGLLTCRAAIPGIRENAVAPEADAPAHAPPLARHAVSRTVLSASSRFIVTAMAANIHKAEEDIPGQTTAAVPAPILSSLASVVTRLSTAAMQVMAREQGIIIAISFATIATFPPINAMVKPATPATSLGQPSMFSWFWNVVVVANLVDQSLSVLGYMVIEASGTSLDADFGIGYLNMWNCAAYWTHSEHCHDRIRIIFISCCLVLFFLFIATGES